MSEHLASCYLLALAALAALDALAVLAVPAVPVVLVALLIQNASGDFMQPEKDR